MLLVEDLIHVIQVSNMIIRRRLATQPTNVLIPYQAVTCYILGTVIHTAAVHEDLHSCCIIVSFTRSTIEDEVSHPQK
jgi:hypothetical protein